MWPTIVILLGLSQLLAGCIASLPKEHIQGPRTYKDTVDIRAGGFRRSYLVHIPSGYAPETSLPLVVVIHGAFDTADGMERFSGFSRLADRENFVVLYPNGMGILGFLQHWNAGHCCGIAARDNLDDVGFVAATIEDVCARVHVDRHRIYMVGFSNGGMLAYRFAAERGDLVAAVAPLAASIGGRPAEGIPEWRIPEPVQPVSIITMHGLLDDGVPYEGGVSHYRGGSRTYRSVAESVGFWVDRNGCREQEIRQSMYGGRVSLKWWKGCKNDTEVALYSIKEWGHLWPGQYFMAALPEDDPLRNFDAAEIIWDFFKSHRRRPEMVNSN
jgi:polyhydroxybutyrate depolymerase